MRYQRRDNEAVWFTVMGSCQENANARKKYGGNSCLHIILRDACLISQQSLEKFDTSSSGPFSVFLKKKET